MSIDIVDVVVLGLGVAGEAVANELADAGLEVVGIDERLVGGECAYWGCIPTKIMVREANLLAEARRAGIGADQAEMRAGWERSVRRVREATGAWDDGVAVRRFEHRGGRFVRGHGRFVSPDVIEVNGMSLRARRAVVVASGTAPSLPPIRGLERVPFWTNREAVESPSLPESIAVVGGGSVGVEFAQAWQRFGSSVTLIEPADRLLEHEEPEAGALITRVLRDEGVDVRTGVRIERAGVGDDQTVELHTTDGNSLRAERLMLAAGRDATLHALDAACAGLDEEAQAIEVDDHLRAAPGIWAVGDVTSAGGFTHVATYQARIAVADILGRPTAPARYHAVPRVTFSDPELGAVGMTEQQAVEQARNVRTACVDLSKTSRGFVHGAGSDGLIKLVVDASTSTLLGATSVGPNGGEVLSMLALAVHTRLTIDVLAEMIYAFPTFHRAVLDAVERLRS